MQKTCATLAYDAATGTQLWVERYDAPTGRASAGSLALSPAGTTVYVTGWAETVSGQKDYATVAYEASTGSQAWVSTYQGAGGDNEGRAVAVTPDGSKLFVVGSSASGTGLGYTTVAYGASSGTHDAFTGKKLWAAGYHGPANGDDRSASIWASPTGNRVFVTGTSEGAGSGSDLTTVAYSS